MNSQLVDGFQFRVGTVQSMSSNNIITPQATKSVANAYVKVMDEVCSAVRDTFLDEGVESSILQDLRRLWETKLYQSKVRENESC